MSLRIFSSTASIKRSMVLRLYSSTAGFTALEMLISVAIIVLLLGIVAITFRDQGPKNRNAERRNEVNGISHALTQWSLDTGTYLLPDLPSSPNCIGTDTMFWPQDIRVNKANSILGVSYPSASFDSAGNIFVVWRNDTNDNIYAQKISQTGAQLLSNDLRVNNRTGTMLTPLIAVDGTGNIIVAWEEWLGTYYDTYIQKFSPAGARLWNSGNDLKVNANGTQGSYSMSMDSSNDVIIAWVRNDNNVYAQKLLSLNGQKSWNSGSDLKVNLGGTALKSMGDVAVNSAGGVVVAWTDQRNGGRDVYLQTLNSNGVQILSSDFKVNIDNNNLVFRNVPSVTTDSNNNFIIAWTDGRNGNRDIYAQKISPDTAQRLWNSGQDFKISTDPGTASQDSSKIIVTSNNSVIIIWSDTRYSVSVYGQKFSPDGTQRIWNNEEDRRLNYNQSALDPFLAINSDDSIAIVWSSDDIYIFKNFPAAAMIYHFYPSNI